MKAENLLFLKKNGINVPSLTVVREGEKADISFSESEMFAVRSSCDNEDGSDLSYAGQFDTFLNVRRDEVQSKVKKVFESLHGSSVQHYRSAMGEQAEGSMSVIVQEMIDADISGVMFTANPAGILNETVIVAGYGTGDGVVCDAVDTTTYYYSNDDKLYYYEKTGDSPVLSREVFTELIRNCSAIKKLFGKDMDIEFAVRDSVVYILQARPVTTLNTEKIIILDNSNIVESYPGICLPLTQEFVTDVYYRVFRALILRLTADRKLTEEMDADLKKMTAVANGRIYYQISNWYQVLRLLPFEKKIIPLWQEMLGVENRTVVSVTRKTSMKVKARIVFMLFKSLADCPSQMKKLNLFFEKYIKDFDVKLSEAEKPGGELQQRIQRFLKLFEEIFETIANRWDVTLINDMYTFIYTGLSGRKNRKYISDIGNLESMKPVRQAAKLADTAAGYGTESAEYRKAAQEYIDIYGDRCLNELKLETRTFRTDPGLLDEYIKKRCAGQEHQQTAADSTEKTGRKHRGLFVKLAAMGIRNREKSRMNRTRLFGTARRIFLDIGSELCSAGFLEKREDVFFITVSELEKSALSGDFSGLAALREEAERKYHMHEKIPPYSRLVFSERISEKVIHDAFTGYSETADELSGTAASQGKVTGEVIVVESPDITTDTAGKIIVTQMTDPGWVFLIENALGIIAEKGSLLSHTAIITRELGRPSVVNVKDAARVLKTGDVVELDAFEGKVRILSR